MQCHKRNSIKLGIDDVPVIEGNGDCSNSIESSGKRSLERKTKAFCNLLQNCMHLEDMTDIIYGFLQERNIGQDLSKKCELLQPLRHKWSIWPFILLPTSLLSF